MEKPGLLNPSIGMLQKLFDSLHEIVCALDAQGRFVYINQACYKIWGYQPEELIGVSCFDLMVEEDRHASLKATHEAYNGADIPNYENRYYRKDGSVATMFWDGGWNFEDQLIYTTGRDISESKRLEKLGQLHQIELERTKTELENMLDRITDGFIGLDENARVTYWNKAAETISQIPSRDVINHILWDVIPEQGKARYQKIYANVKSANRPMHLEHFSERIGRWLEISTYVSGSGLSVYFRDVTDKKNLQDQLIIEKDLQQKRITKAVIKAAEQERALVSNELHDNVNQVLTTVKLYMELCLTNRDQKEDLLRKSIELIMVSIDEIRKLSRRLSVPTMGAIGMKESLEELVDVINVTKRLHIHFDYCLKDSEISEEVHLAIYRITQEHLTNILNHAEAKNVFIRLVNKNGMLHLEIVDDGKGFDMHQKRKGIGITNMVTRTENLNGTIDLKSASGAGTTLSVIIPLQTE